MAVNLLQKPEFQFAAITFFAKQHKGESCGSNGLPLTPNSITIYGKAQILKTVKHKYLCEYLDIIRGKHERTIVVFQYCGKPLSEYIAKEVFEQRDVEKIAYQILVALNELHAMKIVHRNLCSDNILLQGNLDVKLFNYGLYHMSGKGQLVSFPIIQPLYAPPEVYLQGANGTPSNFSADIWSFGIILVEIILNKPLWSSLKLGQRIRKILSLIQCNTSIFERIAREHNAFNEYQNTPTALKDIIESCLSLSAKERPTAAELLENKIFDSFKSLESIPENRSKVCKKFENFTLREFYHWWQLAGGDVLLELKKQGLIRSSPPILSLPSCVFIEGIVVGQERNLATLFDPRIVVMPLETLYQRLGHIRLESYYPLIHNNSEIIAANDPPAYDAVGLPVVIKEKDPEYQFHRIILLRRLLQGYPFTRDLIVKEAEKDIPPLLRGDIWAALLNVRGDYQRNYIRIDKETPTNTDRQIEVDIPRCHQYNELLSSSEGHKKLKRILKAWVAKNKEYVYWQGLDSLTAPFLYLNFNDEAKAFACLSSFVPKYLHKFFLKDNSAIIQEYLVKFSQLIAFHDPILANHLHSINFIPELFAIPWFLTMFSHVFPLHKIMHLWDELLLRDSSFPLHIGLSVLTQLRDRLLSSGFNECILLFSDLPEVDIEKCVKCSLKTYFSTPKSITARAHQNCLYYPCDENMSFTKIPLKDLVKERCPRISVKDVVDLVQNDEKNIVIIDIRNPIQFNRCHVRDSVNIPYSSITFDETEGSALTAALNEKIKLLLMLENKIFVIVGPEETDFELVPKFFLMSNISRVCILHGGFGSLVPITPSILVHQNQI